MPKYVIGTILVLVDSPRKSTYGGVVAAPVFRQVAEYALARRGIRPRRAPGPQKRPPDLAAAPPPLEEKPCEGVPSLLGLGMREALLRAREMGWKVSVEGSGYVIAQDPPPGAEPGSGELALTLGSAAS